MHRYDVARITGPIIKQLRKSRKLTQKELGFLMNVSRNAVTNWECGSRMPSADQYHELSKIFEVPVAYILGETMFNEKVKKNEDILDIGELNDLGKRLISDMYERLKEDAIYTQNLTIVRHGMKKGCKSYVLYKKKLLPDIPEEVDPRDIILSQLENDDECV